MNELTALRIEAGQIRSWQRWARQYPYAVQPGADDAADMRLAEIEEEISTIGCNRLQRVIEYKS